MFSHSAHWNYFTDSEIRIRNTEPNNNKKPWQFPTVHLSQFFTVC